MRVLLVGQLGLGGAERQIAATAAELTQLGPTIDVSAEDRPDCRGCDLLHVFNAPDPGLTLKRIEAGKRRGVPVALSTIYWNGYELYMQWAKRGWRTAEEQTYHWQQRKQGLQPVFAGADMWLPNSHAEYGLIVADFEVSRPYQVVCNAVETGFSESLPTPKEQSGQGCPSHRGTDMNGARASDILMVGRWELRKNQLGLLEALADTDHRILIIGGENSYDREHNQAARRLAQQRGNVQILPQTTDRAFVAAVMKNARVLAQPSFYETPGLAALEAAVCGAAVVVAERGCTREYFGDEAYYCDPTDAGSIRRAIEAALAGGPSPGLKERIGREFTWRRAAEQTKLAYEQLLTWTSSS